MAYVDSPDKKQKDSQYEKYSEKLDLKDNEFSGEKFQEIRASSMTHKELLKAFSRVGLFLNNKLITSIPTEDLRKVCFIMINDFADSKKKSDVGPLNDGYLIALKHHRLGFKIMYLYNSGRFTTFLDFFMKYTTEALTVFYSGKEENLNHIEFKDGTLSKSSITEVIKKNSQIKIKVMFITDTIGGGSLFDISSSKSNMISLFSDKKNNCDLKKQTHGIVTYYFCKITGGDPSISSKRLLERMNPSLYRFGEEFKCELTNEKQSENPIFC